MSNTAMEAALTFLDRALTRDREGDLVHLGPNDCICRKCGLSQKGYLVKETHRDEGYYTCQNGCVWGMAVGLDDIPVEVFTQEDFETGLQNASDNDHKWLKRNYPHLYRLSENYWGRS